MHDLAPRQDIVSMLPAGVAAAALAGAAVAAEAAVPTAGTPRAAVRSTDRDRANLSTEPPRLSPGRASISVTRDNSKIITAGRQEQSQKHDKRRPRLRCADYRHSMIVTLAWPPPSHIVSRP